MNTVVLLVLALLTALVTWLVYHLFILPRFDPLQVLAGPPLEGRLANHLGKLLDPGQSPKLHEDYVRDYGRSIRIRGIGPWDERLLTLDPVSISYVLKNSTLYEKPWQSQKLIVSLIGCGMLAAEGQVHKRQRRVATPAFSIQNLRALVPLVFKKGTELKDKWTEMISQAETKQSDGIVFDVCHWVSRATFDVIGVAGFDYNFNAIQNEDNELFNAYKEMFEIAISQGDAVSTLITIYAPFIYKFFPNKVSKTVAKCQEVIHRVAGHLVQEKKRKIAEGQKSGKEYNGRDLLSLLLKSNVAEDLPPDQRISDEDILNNINTFTFAGSDTSSLALTWTLLLLAVYPDIQDRLRNEMLSAFPESMTDVSDLTEDEIQTIYATISKLPLLNNVTRESIRLIPPVHSSIRVAMEDDEIPTSFPIKLADGSYSKKPTVSIRKGSFVHVAVEAFNLDKEFWGPDAWQFKPDRWDNLPEAAAQLPGLYSNTLSFSAGPRSCIGMRFSMIEIKTFLYILVTRFVFKPTDAKIRKNNVVLTRPYVSGQYSKGSQCPLIVTPYKPDPNEPL